MTKIDWKRKLSSRKLWAAVAGIVTGLAMVFGLDENTISTVAGAVVSVASVVAYIMAEGKVDAEGVKNAVDSVQDAGIVLEAAEEVLKMEERTEEMPESAAQIPQKESGGIMAENNEDREALQDTNEEESADSSKTLTDEV